MAFRTSHLTLLVLIVAYLCVDVRSAATNGTAGATEQVKDGTASGQASASADAKPSELHGARDEFVGGVAAIGDSARRAGQAVVKKADAVRDNLQDAGHKISENIGQSWQNTKDIVSNIGNTNANAGTAAESKQ